MFFYSVNYVENGVDGEQKRDKKIRCHVTFKGVVPGARMMYKING